MTTVLIAIIILLVFVIVIPVSIYNGLVTFRNRFKNAYSQIDVQLKRRYDLIPNLVETAKGYLKHERQTLEAVIAARNSAFQAAQKASASPGEMGTMKALAGAEVALGGALGRLMAVVEGYPDLKANQNMMQIQEELSSTENRISFARQAYNDAVMNYNIAREKFPNSLIAGPFNFTEAQLWEMESVEERKVPKVSFG
jgi:LemA protein